ncbi:MAG: DUF370 domain-containing protein [Clostridia bacterium]
MYLHIGSDYLINSKNIVGIFDIESSTTVRTTRDFLARAELDGRVITIGIDLPKSFIISNDDKIYITHIAPTTLKKRVFNITK